MGDLFALQTNIARFRDLLATDLNPDKRRTVERLLVEHEAQLQQSAAWRDPHNNPHPNY